MSLRLLREMDEALGKIFREARAEAPPATPRLAIVPPAPSRTPTEAFDLAADLVEAAAGMRPCDRETAAAWLDHAADAAPTRLEARTLRGLADVLRRAR